mmetsp:Transcript_88230/g.238934  ORF Transcript_88230/g.238934 Transcript_88230/m.238934 type:complete len:270 (-) Transcript_88230:843-1652(-)
MTCTGNALHDALHSFSRRPLGLLVATPLEVVQCLHEVVTPQLVAPAQGAVVDPLARLGLVHKPLHRCPGLVGGLKGLVLHHKSLRQSSMRLPRVPQLHGPPSRRLREIRLPALARRAAGELRRDLQQQVLAISLEFQALLESVAGLRPILQAEVHEREQGPHIRALVVQKVGLVESLVAHLKLVRSVLGIGHAAPSLSSGQELDGLQVGLPRLLPTLLRHQHAAQADEEAGLFKLPLEGHGLVQALQRPVHVPQLEEALPLKPPRLLGS